MEAMDCSPPLSLSFTSLPQLCQNRFIQLCPVRDLCKFSRANKYCQKLTSKRPMVNSVKFGIQNCCDRGYCTCGHTTQKQNILLKKLRHRFQVIDLVEISEKGYMLERIHSNSIPNLNLSLKRDKILRLKKCFLFTELNLETYMIDFDALIILIKQPLKKFTFKGGINFNCSFLDYKVAFDKIANVDWVRFTIMLYACAYLNATAEQISFFLIDNVKGFTEHFYTEKEIIYNNLTREEAILKCFIPEKP